MLIRVQSILGFGRPWRALTQALATVLALLLWPAATHAAQEMEPIRMDGEAAIYSEGVIRVALQIDQDGARVLRVVEHERPFIYTKDSQVVSESLAGSVERLRLDLIDAQERLFRHHVILPGLCLDHGSEEPPHIQGDTIQLHRDTIVIELPRLEWPMRLEVSRFPLRSEHPRHIDSAVVPRPESRSESDLDDPPKNGVVTWPAPGEPEYKLWGDATQVGERINVVIVPDGYKVEDKATMEANAQSLVDTFRATTPYKEHDIFFNYILVYAYSNDDGTTQCDCNLNRNTAMATSFPKVVDKCGDGANRCLYYTNSCNPAPAGVDNISAAVLRAPANDATIVMVNTTRYGGCGGNRAVYSAGAGSANLIAIHELGHSLARLADEYGGAGCGQVAGEINTSTNSKDGAWKEWIADIGAPRQGGQYHDECIYRPEDHCMMRTLGPPFCHVCDQQWALQIFGNARVASKAPIDSLIPPTTRSLQAPAGVPRSFTVHTRLPTGTDNSVDWTVSGPHAYQVFHPGNDPEKLEVTFSCQGTYTVSVKVTADKDLIKPEKYGANQESRSWTVIVDGCVTNADEASNKEMDHEG